MKPEPLLLPPPQQSPRPAEESGDLFDWSKIADYARFVRGAIPRHKWLSACVFLTVVGLTLLGLWGLPKTYHVESTLLAQRNQVIGALTIAGRNMPGEADAPTRLAAETVLRRDNLIALVRRTELVGDWDLHRAPLGRLRDWVNAKLGRVASEEDMMEVLEATLESRLSVQMTVDWAGEGTLTIAVDWPDAEMAYQLVNAAQQSFLETRHMSEIDNISEAISLLGDRASSLREEIDATALQIENARSDPDARAALSARAEEPVRKRPRVSATPVTTAPLGPADPPHAEEDAAQLKANWEAKKAAIKDLEDARKRRIVELQARLTELRATYADSHPVIVDTLRSIEMASQESPEVTQLRREETDLGNQYRERTGHEPGASTTGLARLLMREPPATRIGAGAPVASRRVAAPDDTDDRAMEFSKAKLRQQMEAYDRLLERIDTARMEQEIAEVNFKYRYTVIRPAQVPRSPAKPKVPVVLAGGVIAAALLALFAAVAADLRSGRILQRWQVERMLELPVIAEIHERA
jgi:uncharacterized protein involved in exopolysaccharide biosynthesis